METSKTWFVDLSFSHCKCFFHMFLFWRTNWCSRMEVPWSSFIFVGSSQKSAFQTTKNTSNKPSFWASFWLEGVGETRLVPGHRGKEQSTDGIFLLHSLQCGSDDKDKPEIHACGSLSQVSKSSPEAALTPPLEFLFWWNTSRYLLSSSALSCYKHNTDEIQSTINTALSTIDCKGMLQLYALEIPKPLTTAKKATLL